MAVTVEAIMCDKEKQSIRQGKGILFPFQNLTVNINVGDFDIPDPKNPETMHA